MHCYHLKVVETGTQKLFYHLFAFIVIFKVFVFYKDSTYLSISHVIED